MENINFEQFEMLKRDVRGEETWKHGKRSMGSERGKNENLNLYNSLKYII